MGFHLIPFRVYIYLTVSFKKKKNRLNQAKHSTQNRIGPIVQSGRDDVESFGPNESLGMWEPWRQGEHLANQSPLC